MIFHFNNQNWNELLANFRRFNIIVSGGSVTKRHILSPVHHRLSQFLVCVEGLTSANVVESFRFGTDSESKPILDFTSKKVGDVIDNIHQVIKLPNSIESINNELNNLIINNDPINQCTVDPDQEIKKESVTLNNIPQEHKNSLLFSNKSDTSSQNNPFTVYKGVGSIRKFNSSSRIYLPKTSDEDRSYVLSYLDSIQNIIKDSEDNPNKAQYIIENSRLNIIEEKLNDKNFLIKRHSHLLSSIVKDANQTLNLLYSKKELKRKFPLIDKDLNRIELLLLTFSLVISYFNKLKLTALSSVVGNSILFEVYNHRRKEVLKSKNKENTFMSYQAFKSYLSISNKEIIKLGDLFISIFLQFPHNLFEREFDLSSYFTHEGTSLSINPSFTKDIKENIVVHPSSLPMLCRPNVWSEFSFGGYLENKIQEVSVITGSPNHRHTIENKNNLYKAINYINSTRFGINNLLLDYLNNEGQFLFNELEEKDSLQKDITLKVAQSFSNIPFYLTVHADWRGRIYTQSFFISYQGGDLSSALINFWKGEVLTEEGKYYLYIYGANNHNGNNIGKASYSERIQWVKDNYEKIINLDRSLILSAENKFVFTAFCLNMKQLHLNSNSIIKTPVFLDATCSGIQHLAALMQDLELGTYVNLVPYKESDRPGDIYSEIVEPINRVLNKFGKENPEFVNLALVKFTRKILKQSIMTKVYNVTTYGIANQLKSKLDYVKKYEDNEQDTNQLSEDIKKNLKKKYKSFYEAPGINGNVLLNPTDIAQIAKMINEQIFVLFPSLNDIYSYFIDITKLMIKLDIPLSWITPNGLKFTQRYLKSKQIKIPIRIFGKTKKVVLKESIDELNKRKQAQAIIPNIIHSLDANHLINLINSSHDQGFGPIITIHDCFGTLPNKMGVLEHRVKKEFILLYSENNFLRTFHDRIIQSMRDNQLILIEDLNKEPSHVIFNDQLIEIPKIPELGKLDLQKIIESRYMVS